MSSPSTMNDDEPGAQVDETTTKKEQGETQDETKTETETVETATDADADASASDAADAAAHEEGAHVKEDGDEEMHDAEAETEAEADAETDNKQETETTHTVKAENQDEKGEDGEIETTEQEAAEEETTADTSSKTEDATATSTETDDKHQDEDDTELTIDDTEETKVESTTSTSTSTPAPIDTHNPSLDLPLSTWHNQLTLGYLNLPIRVWVSDTSHALTFSATLQSIKYTAKGGSYMVVYDDPSEKAKSASTTGSHAGTGHAHAMTIYHQPVSVTEKEIIRPYQTHACCSYVKPIDGVPQPPKQTTTGFFTDYRCRSCKLLYHQDHMPQVGEDTGDGGLCMKCARNHAAAAGSPVATQGSVAARNKRKSVSTKRFDEIPPAAPITTVTTTPTHKHKGTPKPSFTTIKAEDFRAGLFKDWYAKISEKDDIPMQTKVWSPCSTDEHRWLGTVVAKSADGKKLKIKYYGWPISKAEFIPKTDLLRFIQPETDMDTPLFVRIPRSRITFKNQSKNKSSTSPKTSASTSTSTPATKGRKRKMSVTPVSVPSTSGTDEFDSLSLTELASRYESLEKRHDSLLQTFTPHQSDLLTQQQQCSQFISQIATWHKQSSIPPSPIISGTKKKGKTSTTSDSASSLWSPESLATITSLISQTSAALERLASLHDDHHYTELHDIQTKMQHCQHLIAMKTTRASPQSSPTPTSDKNIKHK